MRSGSTVIRSSRVVPPNMFTRATPGTRSRRSWITSSTKSPKVWIGRSLPGLRERMNQAIGWSSEPAALMMGSAASLGLSGTRSNRLATSTRERSILVPTANSSSISPTPSSADPTIRFSPRGL